MTEHTPHPATHTSTPDSAAAAPGAGTASPAGPVDPREAHLVWLLPAEITVLRRDRDDLEEEVDELVHERNNLWEEIAHLESTRDRQAAEAAAAREDTTSGVDADQMPVVTDTEIATAGATVEPGWAAWQQERDLLWEERDQLLSQVQHLEAEREALEAERDTLLGAEIALQEQLEEQQRGWLRWWQRPGRTTGPESLDTSAAGGGRDEVDQQVATDGELLAALARQALVDQVATGALTEEQALTQWPTGDAFTPTRDQLRGMVADQATSGEPGYQTYQDWLTNHDQVGGDSDDDATDHDTGDGDGDGDSGHIAEETGQATPDAGEQPAPQPPEDHPTWQERVSAAVQRARASLTSGRDTGDHDAQMPPQVDDPGRGYEQQWGLSW